MTATPNSPITAKTPPLPSEDILHLLKHSRSLCLATIDNKHRPLSSYAPFLLWEGKITLFLSELAAHTTHLIESKKASVMMIEDEKDSSNIFARRRLILTCQSNIVAKESPYGQQIIDKMETHLGPTMGVLRSLGDFVLFELDVDEGNFVKGFGAAFPITRDEWQALTKAN